MKESLKRISFLRQWQTYQYGTQSPQRYLPLWALLSTYFLYNILGFPLTGFL